MCSHDPVTAAPTQFFAKQESASLSLRKSCTLWMTPIHKYPEEFTKTYRTRRFAQRYIAVGREILTVTWVSCRFTPKWEKHKCKNTAHSRSLHLPLSSVRISINWHQRRQAAAIPKDKFSSWTLKQSVSSLGYKWAPRSAPSPPDIAQPWRNLRNCPSRRRSGGVLWCLNTSCLQAAA